MADFSFAKLDLCEIKIPHAILSHVRFDTVITYCSYFMHLLSFSQAMLDHVNMKNADLSHVHLDGAYMHNANLEGARLEGVEFREFPYLKVVYCVVQVDLHILALTFHPYASLPDAW